MKIVTLASAACIVLSGMAGVALAIPGKTKAGTAAGAECKRRVRPTYNYYHY
ncbi:hypothetical protein [Sinorhizobium meliloti]|uniref:hypothetical protein n=1 Tax=Rhizobium meliloti TaxID=382 RepID=UPI001F38274B|nr:hypothetical protein [Sinorhizobium meliloti]